MTLTESVWTQYYTRIQTSTGEIQNNDLVRMVFVMKSAMCGYSSKV